MIDIDLGADTDIDTLAFAGEVDGLIVRNYLPSTDAKIDVADITDWSISSVTIDYLKLSHTNGQDDLEIYLQAAAATTGLDSVSDWLQ